MTSTNPEIHNDHNVYILGAGFSVAAGLPTVADFLDRMRDAIDILAQDPDRVPEYDAIMRVFKLRSRASAAAQRVVVEPENIEDLFSLAAFEEGTEPEFDIRLAIATTLDLNLRSDVLLNSVYVDQPETEAIPDHWIPQQNGRWHNAPNYDVYVGAMAGYFSDGGHAAENRKTTIISFNYDTLVEDALIRLGIDFTYGLPSQTLSGERRRSKPDAPDLVAVLKMHGSVNWAKPSSGGNKLTEYRSYNDVRNSGLIPEIVPPTANKALAGPLTDVWQHAARALDSATHVLIIGLSLRPADQAFRFLLAAGLAQNISLRKIHLIDNDMNNLRTNAEALFVKKTDSSREFAEYRGTVESMLTRTDVAKEIGRPFRSDFYPQQL